MAPSRTYQLASAMLLVGSLASFEEDSCSAGSCNQSLGINFIPGIPLAIVLWFGPSNPGVLEELVTSEGCNTMLCHESSVQFDQFVQFAKGGFLSFSKRSNGIFQPI